MPVSVGLRRRSSWP
jgi:ribosomal protein S21